MQVVTKEKGEEMGANYSLNYIETSAKNDYNVYEAFVNLTKEILKKKGQGLAVGSGEAGGDLISVENQKKAPGKKTCC